VESFDLIVIGSGPAREKGAAQAAYFGKRVALVERHAELGGAGVNTGTVPSKTLRESALYFSGLRARGLYGIDYSLREGLTVQGFMHRKDAVVSADARRANFRRRRNRADSSRHASLGIRRHHRYVHRPRFQFSHALRTLQVRSLRRLGKSSRSQIARGVSRTGFSLSSFEFAALANLKG
jgi:pyruvate/2-oxoglutarate dehydrogenase complex dihydrolipoamide dehydrogenase (E3) component